MAGSDIPLLNHYKKKFVAKRLPQTLLGGVTLKLGYPTPCYVYLSQILLWLTPFLIGGAFTLAVEVAGLQALYASIGNGVAVGVLAFSLQLASKIIAGRDSSVDEDGVSISSRSSALNTKIAGRLLAEEDEVIFDSFCSSSTLLFIIPPKRYYASIILSSLISAFVNGIGMWYSLPYTTFTALYGYSTVGSVFLFVFSWIVICIGHYPLLIGNMVPETATYRSVDFYETQNLWRALHISLFFCPFLVDLIVDDTILTDVNSILHIVFCCLPALWLLGILPPMDALVLWAMEQFLTFGLGGSAMSTDWRLLFMSILSSSVLVGLSFATSTQVLVSCSVGFGFLLSTDITSIVFDAVSKIRHFLAKTTERSTKIKSYDKDQLSEQKSTPEKSFSWKRALFLFIVFSIAFAGTYLAHFYSASVTANTAVKSGFEYTILAIFVLTIICKECQKVYVVFGVFRNCLYPLTTLSQTAFEKRKRYLKIFGVINEVFMHFIFPLLSSIYLSFYLFQSTATVLPSFQIALGCVHSLRFIWQRPGNALATFAYLSILNLIPGLSLTVWGTLFIGTRLLVIDACRDRIFQFFDNIWFAVVLIVTSWTDKKQKRSLTLPLIVLNAVFFPVTLGIILIASVLSAPLLPVFTLPIFIIGFPRPSKFWPAQPGSTQANVCADTIYYQELLDPVSKWFSSEVGLGVVDSPASSLNNASPFYIARTQDRTLWIQVLESGYGYTSFLIKGLELQETSCHSLEATRLDDAFDIAFEKVELDLRCMRTNQYVGTSSVTPVDSAFINSHSDAKNSLKGIVDHPDTIRQLRADFLKSLSWILSHYIANKCTTSSKASDVPTSDRKVDDFVPVPNGKRQLSAKSQKLDSESLHLPNAVVEADNALPPQSRVDSLVSFMSILTDDDRPHSRTKNDHMEMKRRPNSGKNSGTRQRLDSDDLDLDSILSDSGYGLPAIDAGFKKKGKNEAVMSNSTFRNNQNGGVADSYVQLYGGGTTTQNQSALISLIPQKWNEIPVSNEDLNESRKVFDSKWLEHCLTVACKNTGNDLQIIAPSLPAITNLVLSCDAIINIMGVPGKDPSLLGADHMRKVYTDDIPWSPALDWLKEQKDLHDKVIKAYRYAAKLMYDQASLGAVENFDELSDYLSEYDEDWFIGTEADPEWKKRLIEGKSHLFAISHNSTKREVSARVLSKQSVSLNLGRVNPAAVRAIWSNFALEMIYATNDDEERYSIQAHVALLRNLIVQTADPPLGYPIFSTRPRNTSTFRFV